MKIARVIALAGACCSLALLLACAPPQPASAPEPTPPAAPEPTSSPTGRPLPLDRIELALTPLVRGLEQPVFLTHAGDSSGRLFVVEQTGRIRVIRGGGLQPGAFLDVSRIITTGGERGLLGLAFPADFEASGRFYVNYTDIDGNTVVARYVADDPSSDRPKLDGPEVLLSVKQPYANHNGGGIAFGPDEMLWVGMGDGGSGGDPQGNGQNPKALLGKMLRLDVSGTGKARAAADNPGAAGGSALAPEAIQLGLRNPWRFSFDRSTGDLWIGDVGQNAWEEIDYVPRVEFLGANFGWNRWEGNHPYPKGSKATSKAGLTFPITEYAHDQGQSVTGGYVYRGRRYPVLDGTYLYGDFAAGWVAGLQRLDDGSHPAGATLERRLLEGAGNPSSFGEDEEGELYLVDYGGTVYRISATEKR